MSNLDCTYSGAEFPSKKHAVFAQNIENKGPAIFLPPRSMVLKVVRGKILETLELRPRAAAQRSVLGTRVEAVFATDFAFGTNLEGTLMSDCHRSYIIL